MSHSQLSRSRLTCASLLAAALLSSASATAQTVVDHTQWQTPQQSQGNRTTCITFAAVAALEARYKRIGQNVDLSEEFVNYLRKMFWLHPDWSAIQAQSADYEENQLGATGGGAGTDVLEWLASGMAAPRENFFPYRSTNYPLPYPWHHSHWDSQYNSNSWNLDPDNLPRTALRAPEYFFATGFQRMTFPNVASSIEAVLDAGYEVVWDFNVAGDRSGPIWHASSAAPIGAHSMVIIGYDKSHSDPNQHHFICKNSWNGSTGHPHNWTWIGYDYIQYGYGGAYVTGAGTPKEWPELQLLGRRQISYDGWSGTLDIYHLPGINQMYLDRFANGVTDRRVGTFYDHNGVAHRVNGYAYGKTLNFWFKGGSAANMRWDEQRETPTVGRNFLYTIVDNDGKELAGRHYDNPGLVPNPSYGGYARMPSSILANDGRLSVVASSNPNTPEQYLGSWTLKTAGAIRELRFTHRNDNLLTLQQQFVYAAIAGEARISANVTVPIMMRVRKASPRSITLVYTDPTHGLISLEGWMLSWQKGVVGGRAVVGNSPDEGFYLARAGNYTEGTTSTFGTACGPAGQQPNHYVVGYPDVDTSIWFTVSNLQPGDLAVLALGANNTVSGGIALPMPLAAVGMPGCNLYLDPIQTWLQVGSSGGLAFLVAEFTPNILGHHVYSQWFVLKPGANAAGIIASNGVDMMLGGTY